MDDLEKFFAGGSSVDAGRDGRFIELENIHKRFVVNQATGSTAEEQTHALQAVDLSIDWNKVTVIKGPSGSGKTTLLTIVGCMAKPTVGRVRVNGLDVSSLPERFLSEVRRRYFGFVFQDYHLIRGITALENTMLPAYPTNQRPGEIRRRAETLLDRFGILQKAGIAVEQLSGGERQRVAIARSLMNEPVVVVADEPTAHLNTELAEEFLEIVAGLEKDGKTVLMASHDPLVIESDKVHRVFELRDGKMVNS